MVCQQVAAILLHLLKAFRRCHYLQVTLHSVMLPPCLPARSRQHNLWRFISLGLRAGRVFGTTGVRFELSAIGTQVLEPRLQHAPALARLCECTRSKQAHANTIARHVYHARRRFFSCLSFCAQRSNGLSHFFLNECLASKIDCTVCKGAKHVCACLRCER